jgi:hypothetical protein
VRHRLGYKPRIPRRSWLKAGWSPVTPYDPVTAAAIWNTRRYEYLFRNHLLRVYLHGYIHRWKPTTLSLNTHAMCSLLQLVATMLPHLPPCYYVGWINWQISRFILPPLESCPRIELLSGVGCRMVFLCYCQGRVDQTGKLTGCTVWRWKEMGHKYGSGRSGPGIRETMFTSSWRLRPMFLQNVSIDLP